jgi:2-C-methyl-D-erythritol 2,4-cyclodiphosphate synthase
MRIGHGLDAHRLVAGRKLILGGVEIAHERGLEGHSDADVLVHAIIDALLGAAGLGDIGGMFPSDDARWSGASSIAMLAQASERVRAAGYGVENVDATVVCEAPRLAVLIESMRANIAKSLDIDINLVNVKATTTDGLGFTGRREGIAAFAVVLLDSIRVT